MSQTETGISPAVTKQELQVEPPPIPKWGLETVRYVGRSLSRLFFRIRYTNLENIPQDRPGGLLICANHQSFFDPFWICFPIKRSVRYMTWDAATRWFIIGNFIRALGAFPVNIERGDKGALKMSLGWLRSGGTLVVFPEGSRCLADGKMLPFKNGAVRIALETKVPILPVTVVNGHKVWAQDMKTPRLAPVEIIYHPLFEIPPVPEGGNQREHINFLNQKLTEIIAAPLPNE